MVHMRTGFSGNSSGIQDRLKLHPGQACTDLLEWLGHSTPADLGVHTAPVCYAYRPSTSYPVIHSGSVFEQAQVSLNQLKGIL